MMRLDRRTFLRGTGLGVGLPMLEAMRPVTSAFAAETAASPVRMAYVFFPNGAIMDTWKPTGEGTQYELSTTLKELAEFRNDMNVITGLAQDMGRAHGDGAGDHARCASTFLTGAHPVKTSSADIKVGVSVDQVAAKQIGSLTRLPSLELGLTQGANAGNCDSGYSCAYSSNISWKTESVPMAKEIVPRLAFERIFGTGEQAAHGRKYRDFFRKSILDLVQQDAARLRKNLGQADQLKMDEYLQSVRELEVRVIRAEEMAKLPRPDIDLPEGRPDNVEEHMHLMYDILALAFQTDSTRIATFMLGNAGSNRSYRMVGVNEGHHQLSHHRNRNDMMDKIRKIDAYLAKGFGYFLSKLRSIEEQDGNLLDHSMIVYGSGLGDANRHNHHDLPVVVAGKGGGSIATGRHILLSDETPMNNLFLSMLDRVGAKVESIGDSSGRLTQLDA